jgi:uncharacterized protein (DUF433 family)
MTDLRDCFDILPDRRAMRLKGTGIDWEHVIQLFQAGLSPEDISAQYGNSVSLELIYAAVTYYLLNKAEYEEYVRQGDEIAKQQYDRYWASLTPEERRRQEGLRTHIRDLKARFTDAHGRLDYQALKAHMADQRSQPAGAGA